LDQLPADLAERLQAARIANRDRAHIDETLLMPAWQRYAGTLYQVAHSALEKAVEDGRHLLILSGGYGIVTAREPIGMYEARFRATQWPKGLIEAALSAYAIRHRVQHVRAIVSATTGYCSIMRKVRWADVGISDAVLIAPNAGLGAMVKAPRAEGEALSALLNGNLDTDFVSSDGLGLSVSLFHRS
jgi:hypothetical protein